MIKSELIAAIAGKMTHLPENSITKGVNRILQLMSQTLTDNGRIEVRGFGSFSLHYRPPRDTRNPQTGAKIQTPAKYSPHFKPGKDLRERIDKAKRQASE